MQPSWRAGVQAHMIPVHVAIHAAGTEKNRKLNFEVLDLPALTPQAVMVSVYDALLESNDSTADTSYHIQGSIDLDGYPPSPLDLWVAGGNTMSQARQPPLRIAVLDSDRPRPRIVCPRGGLGEFTTAWAAGSSRA